jgi:hypothetical protein
MSRTYDMLNVAHFPSYVQVQCVNSCCPYIWSIQALRFCYQRNLIVADYLLVHVLLHFHVFFTLVRRMRVLCLQLKTRLAVFTAVVKPVCTVSRSRHHMSTCSRTTVAWCHVFYIHCIRSSCMVFCVAARYCELRRLARKNFSWYKRIARRSSLE